MKKVILFAIVSVILFFGCQKEQAYDKSQALMSKLEIENVGKRHNEIVYEVIRSDKEYKSINEVIRNVDTKVTNEGSLINLNQSDAEAFGQGIPEKVLSRFNNHKSYSWVKKIFSIDFDNITLKEAVEHLSNIEKEAKNSISDKNELTAVLVSISVAKNSAELWMSKNQGGLALSEKIIKKQNFFSPELRDIGFDNTNIDGGSTSAKADPTKTKKTSIIVASDAIGAYAGFIQTAVLAPIPGANAAIAANTVLQGATASILSAISLW